MVYSRGWFRFTNNNLNKSNVLKIPNGCSSVAGRAFFLPQGERDGGW
jgi:hypothetical protein